MDTDNFVFRLSNFRTMEEIAKAEKRARLRWGDTPNPKTSRSLARSIVVLKTRIATAFAHPPAKVPAGS